jgi:hypothetical protein
VGIWLGRFATVLCVLACGGCALGIGTLGSEDSTQPATSMPVLTSNAPAAAETVAPAPYVDPTDELRGLATRFVVAALSYDAWTEPRAAFLGRLAGLATDVERARLRRSERAHLRWWVLRQRLEHTTVHVLGVSQNANAAAHVELHVELTRTTRSTVSTVREFVAVALVVVHTPQGWRVDRAQGGGL